MGGAASLRVALTHVYGWPEVRRGAERYLHELAGALHEAGHQVSIIATAVTAHEGRERDVPVRYLRRRHVLTRRFGQLSAELAFGGQSFGRLALAKVDVWHAMGTADAAASCVLGTVRGVRSVYTDHGFPYRPSRKRRPDRRLHDLVVARVDRYVCVSNAAAQTLLDGYGRAGEVRSGGVDVRRFTPGDSRDPSRALLFVGDAGEERKNLPLLRDALVAMRQRGVRVHLWVAGPGDQRGVIGELPASASDAVTLLGEVAPDDLVELYGRASVTVLPARAEAFGLALVESLACGTPVVALNQGGPLDIVQPGIGVLCDETAEDLARACEEALDLAAQHDIVERCRDAAMAWDWRTAIVPEMERIYGAG
jgi:glycosyltransferase involved in cell wall biosynthesis